MSSSNRNRTGEEVSHMTIKPKKKVIVAVAVHL